ncbi:MAG: hypothetical protein ACLR17_03945 [Enterobacteriaceae bacterium]
MAGSWLGLNRLPLAGAFTGPLACAGYPLLLIAVLLVMGVWG